MKNHYINGAWIEGTGDPIEKIDPSTGKVIAKFKTAAPDQVADSVLAARSAFPDWAILPVAARQAHLETFAKTLKEDGEKLASTIAQEIGKPAWEAATEVQAMIGKIGISIDAFEKRCSEFEGGPAITRFHPHGVVAVPGPFNFPGHLPNGHIVPALLAGNTVIFKASELAPLTAQVMLEIWEKSGLPPGVLNLVQGGVDTSRALVENPDLDGVFFTGSANVGESLREFFSTRPGKILALEMGGNNPLVVEEVDNIEAAVLVAIQSAYLTAGQRCTCARRMIVPKGKWGERFVEAFKQKAEQILVGPPDQDPAPFMGPVISEKATNQILEAQTDLLKLGASSILDCCSLKPGTGFLSPGIIDVTEIENRQDDEVFGPLVQVIRVSDFNSALAEARDTKFGLAAGLISDSAENWNRFQNEVRAGVMNWNQQTTGASSAAPFGGVGRSGNFRPGAYLAADYCSRPVASIEINNLALPIKEPIGFK